MKSAKWFFEEKIKWELPLQQLAVLTHVVWPDGPEKVKIEQQELTFKSGICFSMSIVKRAFT